MADVPMFLRIISPISNLAGGGSKKDGKRPASGAKAVAYKRGGKVKKAKRAKGRKSSR